MWASNVPKAAIAQHNSLSHIISVYLKHQDHRRGRISCQQDNPQPSVIVSPCLPVTCHQGHVCVNYHKGGRTGLSKGEGAWATVGWHGHVYVQPYGL